jgi:orotidine-5'-phosphate decarboxylase
VPNFVTRLEQACEANQSLVCVGLDVDPARMPVDDAFEFNKAIIDATGDLVCAYKPNLGFYEAMGMPGLTALQRTVDYIRRASPQAVVIGDAKRGDIGSTAQVYAHAMFQVWDFDAVTVNAWGGLDTLEPYLEYEDRGVFIWCRGSNPGAADLQDLTVDTPQGKMPLYQHLAHAAQTWNSRGNVGLVMGATQPEQLGAVRRICPDLPLLIPGVGAQSGELEAFVPLGVDGRGRLAIINSSRAIIYASEGPDFAAAARREAAGLREAVNRILESEGKGWLSS